MLELVFYLLIEMYTLQCMESDSVICLIYDCFSLRLSLNQYHTAAGHYPILNQEERSQQPCSWKHQGIIDLQAVVLYLASKHR